MTKTSPCSWGRMVPASTFKYMSILTRVTSKPLAWRMVPIDAEVMPLPKPETTPPDTKMYLMGFHFITLNDVLIGSSSLRSVFFLAIDKMDCFVYHCLMTYVATITSKRQLTIPSSLFKKANLAVGDKVIIEKTGGELRIKKALDLVEELAGSVSVPAHLKGVDIDKAIEIAKKRYFAKRR